MRYINNFLKQDKQKLDKYLKVSLLVYTTFLLMGLFLAQLSVLGGKEVLGVYAADCNLCFTEWTCGGPGQPTWEDGYNANCHDAPIENGGYDPNFVDQDKNGISDSPNYSNGYKKANGTEECGNASGAANCSEDIYFYDKNGNGKKDEGESVNAEQYNKLTGNNGYTNIKHNGQVISCGGKSWDYMSNDCIAVCGATQAYVFTGDSCPTVDGQIPTQTLQPGVYCGSGAAYNSAKCTQIDPVNGNGGGVCGCKGEGTSVTNNPPRSTPYCGDGNRNNGEQCDPAATPNGCSAGSTCSNSCTCQPTNNPCGNGVINSGEQCDFAASPTGCPAAQTCSSQCTCGGQEEVPGLRVEKVAVAGSGATYVVGSLVPFQIRVTNTGQSTYTNVVFNDSYSTSYLDYVSIFGVKSGGVSINLSGIAVVNEVAGTIQFLNLAAGNALGALGPGQNYTLTSNFLARAPINRTDNCVSVSATDGSGNTRTGQDCDWVRIINADTDL